MSAAEKIDLTPTTAKATPAFDAGILFFVGVSKCGRAVYHHGAWYNADSVKDRMEACGYDYMTLEGDEGYPISGWAHSWDLVSYPKSPEPVKTPPKNVPPVVYSVEVPSNTDPSKTYRVGVVQTPTGLYRATGCTCKAAQEGLTCTHRYQAVVMHTGVIQKACDYFCAKIPGFTPEKFDDLLIQRIGEMGWNAAVSVMLHAWNPTHPLAHLPTLPKAPIQALKAWQKKHAKKDDK